MKKMLSIMLIIASFVCFTACSEDDEENLPNIPTSKQLYVGNTLNLEYEGNWKSTNTFVATVNSKGVATANKAGKAEIYLPSKDLSCQLYVYASYSLYSEPVTQWGISKQQLINACGSNYMVEGDVIGYTTNDDIAPIIMYMFKNGALTTSAIVVKTSYTDELVEHLKQRYKLLTVDTEDYNLYCINANDLSNAETVVIANLYSSKYWMVAYMQNTTTRSNTDYREEIDNLLKQMNFISE